MTSGSVVLSSSLTHHCGKQDINNSSESHPRCYVATKAVVKKGHLNQPKYKGAMQY